MSGRLKRLNKEVHMRRKICGMVIGLCTILTLVIHGYIESGGSVWSMLWLIPVLVVGMAAIRIGGLDVYVEDAE